jgi:hypothetical protein
MAAAVGTGTLSPGLTTTPTVQTSVSLTTTFVVGANAGDRGVFTEQCTFNGASSGEETISQGQGNGTLTCAGGELQGGSASYTRTGGLVTLAGTVTVNGRTEPILAGPFAFVPTSVNPVTSFALAGAIVHLGG